jgi:cytochrome c oxidase subunit IV
MSTSGYRGYWITWFVLLVVTIVLLFLDAAALPIAALLTVVLIGMAIKAGLIGWIFMHLKSENRVLVLTVVVGIIFTCASLWFLLAIDAAWIHKSLP